MYVLSGVTVEDVSYKDIGRLVPAIRRDRPASVFRVDA
jgi:hypothetical protein